MSRVRKSVAGKFIVQVVIKALGPDFLKSIIHSIRKAYPEGSYPDPEAAHDSFVWIMEYLAIDLDGFATAVAEYLSARADEPEVINLVREAMSMDNSDLWKKEEKQEDVLSKLQEAARKMAETGKKPNPKPSNHPYYPDEMRNRPKKPVRRDSTGRFAKKASPARDPETGKFIKKEV